MHTHTVLRNDDAPSILKVLWLSMTSFSKSKVGCCCAGACLRMFAQGTFCSKAFLQQRSASQTRGFLSGCSCCLLVYWVRIYYSAIFLCYVLQSRRGGDWERGPSNSTGVHTDWTVWSSWVAWLFLAQSNSVVTCWSHRGEQEARFFDKRQQGFCKHCLWTWNYVISLRKKIEIGWRSKHFLHQGLEAELQLQDGKQHCSLSMHSLFWGLQSADSLLCFPTNWTEV